MKKIYFVAAASVAVAIISVFLFIGQTNSFQSKIDELSGMDFYNFDGNRIGVFACTIPWEKYPAYKQNSCYRYFGAGVTYDVKQAASWTAFKSLLKTEKNIIGDILYDPNARVIWFTAIRWDEPLMLGTGTLITWFIPA